MPNIAIETTQNVVFEREAATLGDRILATIIDWVVLGVYVLIMFSFLALSVGQFFSGDGSVSGLLQKIIVVLPLTFYHPLMEYFNKGRSLGKMIMKVKVMQLDGSLPTFNSIVLRWLLRLIDFQLFLLLVMLFFPDVDWMRALIVFSPLVALISVGLSKKGQRIGDIVADTTVIKVTKRASLEDTILRHVKKGYQPRYTNVLRLSDRDIRTIKEALEYYHRTGNTEHIRILARKAKELLDVEQKVRPSQFLERLIKDYNHLAVEHEK